MKIKLDKTDSKVIHSNETYDVIDNTNLNNLNTLYSSPLPHVLILTAIVVGISTTALALAIIIRIHAAFGTIEDDEIQQEIK